VTSLTERALRGALLFSYERVILRGQGGRQMDVLLRERAQAAAR
jgi:hypothetical protein